MRKLTRSIAFFLTVIITLTFTACAAKSAFDFDKDAALIRAYEVIDIVNTQNYEEIHNAFSGNVKKLITVDGIKAAFEPGYEQWGTFIEFASADALAVIDKDGTKYINVYVKAKYEKGSFIHTVTFDTDLNLEGFHTK